MENTWLAKAVFNDSFSQINGIGLPWKVSYKEEIEKILETCQIAKINEDTVWKSIIPLINEWDKNNIDKGVNIKTTHSLKWLPMDFVDNGKQSYIDGSPESRIISQFRLGRGQLENRDGSVLLKCTLCHIDADLTEAHVIMSCKAITEEREKCGLSHWCQRNNLTNETEDKKLKLYLGDDGIIGPCLRERGKVLLRLRELFLSKVQEQFDKVMDSLNKIDLRLRANYDLKAPNPIYGQDHSIWTTWSTIIGHSD